jgi:hypothetical protein
VWWLQDSVAYPLISQRASVRLPYRPTLGPLVEPDVEFSSVRLSDDLPHGLISNRCLEAQQLTELV